MATSSYQRDERNRNGNGSQDQAKGVLITALVTEITQALTDATKDSSVLGAMTHQFEAIVADDNTFTIRVIPKNNENEQLPPSSSPSSSSSFNKNDMPKMSLSEANDHGLMASELLEFASTESLDHTYPGDTPPPYP